MPTTALKVTMAHEDSVRSMFAACLAENGAGLRRVARSYSRSQAEAEDLAQEIALNLWRALPSFRGDCSMRTFAFRIAHNRGLSFASARHAMEPLVDHLPDSRPGPEASAAANLQTEALWAALMALPVGSKAVLTLAMEGMTHQEIAEVLGSTVGSVAVRLHKARAELRTLLGDQHGT